MEVKHFDNRIVYYQNGIIHREDGPAVEHRDGSKFWYNNGKLHREDGPAAEYTDALTGGLKEWYHKGQKHREDGPARECISQREWYFKGKQHRVDGPAIEYLNGEKSWYLNDQRHCLDEPAMQWLDRKSWWIRGAEITEFQALSRRAFEITIALAPLQLPAYVVLWIMEWVVPLITKLNQPKLVQMIQNLRNRQLSKI